MELVKLKPAVKDYIWGGKYFQSFGKGQNLERVSECWELSLRPEGPSLIASGKNTGKKLSDVIKNPDIGPIMFGLNGFPLLIKLIDAKENLSVQVHPNDEYAKRDNDLGKTESWLILASDNGRIVYGHNAKTKEELESKARSNDFSFLDYYDE